MIKKTGRPPANKIKAATRATRKKPAETVPLDTDLLRTVIASFPYSVVVTDQKGVIRLANRRTAMLHGYDRWEDMVGMDGAELVPPESKESTLQLYDRVHEDDIVEGIVTLLRKDGTCFPAEVRTVIMRDRTGRVTGFMAVGHDVSERARAEEQITESLREKETLLREIHHRVKNNLQIITSLLNLQGRNIRDEYLQGQFENAQNRIRSMALVHEKLYQSKEFGRIDLASYLSDLAAEIFETYDAGGRIALKIDARPVHIPIELAIPCALIINEILINAFKYAFPPGWSGKPEISISLDALAEGSANMRIGDNGVGIPGSIQLNDVETLGLVLVPMLVRQINGELELDRSGGTWYTVRFKIPAR
ncbi:MAG: PAS domain S-box protein [Spirochaetes bacterium]|nr:PAS domain S-box protein [Spirochaetota bacterium]